MTIRVCQRDTRENNHKKMPKAFTSSKVTRPSRSQQPAGSSSPNLSHLFPSQKPHLQTPIDGSTGSKPDTFLEKRSEAKFDSERGSKFPRLNSAKSEKSDRKFVKSNENLQLNSSAPQTSSSANKKRKDHSEQLENVVQAQDCEKTTGVVEVNSNPLGICEVHKLRSILSCLQGPGPGILVGRMEERKGGCILQILHRFSRLIFERQ